jgi:LysM repeat protein
MQNKKISILLAFVLSFSFSISYGQSADAIMAYISRYKDLAISEMKRTGVPAAITLAQGIHETEAGTSVLVKKSNNHFGIKCKDEWRGQSVSHDDDARGECFRKYSAPEDSYRDHSDFLKTRPNYASLFTLDPTDYQGWAYGLKKAGYATNPKYAQVLIKLIQDYNLEDYTLIAIGKMKEENSIAKNNEVASDKNPPVVQVKNNDNVKATETVSVDNRTEQVNNKTEQDVSPNVNEVNYPSGEFKINDTRVIYVKKGTSYLTIAQQYEIPLARLFEFNDLKQQEVTASDQLVFIQRKRKTGEHEFHTVRAGETLNDIAQSEALRLASLLEYNNITANMQPAIGENLNLRAKSPVTPKLATKNSVAEKLNSGGSVAMNNDGSGKKGVHQKNNFIFHTVQAKETVYSIAKKYDVSADDLISWNQLQDDDLKIGQSLKIYR